MKYRHLFIFYIFLALCGCQHNEQFEHQLSLADTLMRTDADSAFRMLCALDSQAARMPEELQMQHLLLRCNAQNKADSLFSSDSLGLLLTQYFDHHGTPNQRMLARYVLGCAYRDMGDAPSAQGCFNEAIAAADTNAANCDLYQLSIIYGQLGDLHFYQWKANEALEAYHWAEHYATLLHDTLGILTIWSNKSDAYVYQGRILEALELKERTASKLQRLGYRKEAALTRGLCIRWLSESGNLQKAKAYMDEYECYSGNFMKNGDIRPGLERYYEIKGFYFQKAGSLDSAEFYYRKLLHTNHNTYEQYSASWALSQLYKELGKTDSVAKYADLCSTLSSELHLEQSDRNFQQNQSKFNYDRHDQVAKKAIQKAHNYWLELKIIFIILALIMLLSAILYIYSYKKNTELHKSNAALSREKEQLSEKNTELHESNTVLHCEKEQLSEKIIELDGINQQEKKSHEEKERVDAEKIEKLNAELDEYKKVERQRINALKERDLFNEGKVVYFREKACNREEISRRVDFEELSELMERYYPAMQLLRTRYQFSWDDYAICQLIRLGFTLSDIKNLMGLKGSNLSTKRKRMYKKIFGKEGTPDEFDKYINSIDIGSMSLPET